MTKKYAVTVTFEVDAPSEMDVWSLEHEIKVAIWDLEAPITSISMNDVSEIGETGDKRGY